jgi:glycine cleavage system H protein
MNEKRYTADHEWLSIEGDIVTIGITDHAQQALGEIVYVELPEIGRACVVKEAVSVVESVKAASDVYAPVEGEVVEVNTLLEDSPELVNESPEDQGWFMKVRLAGALVEDGLMSHDDYTASL